VTFFEPQCGVRGVPQLWGVKLGWGWQDKLFSL